MVSFRIDDEDADAAQEWAKRLGIDRSELIREALRAHVTRLRAEADAAAWEAMPLTPEETELAEIADWGPAEDWSDWLDATG